MLSLGCERAAELVIGIRYIQCAAPTVLNQARAVATTLATEVSNACYVVKVADPMSDFHDPPLPFLSTWPHFSTQGFKILLYIIATPLANSHDRGFPYTFGAAAWREQASIPWWRMDFLGLVLASSRRRDLAALHPFRGMFGATVLQSCI